RDLRLRRFDLAGAPVPGLVDVDDAVVYVDRVHVEGALLAVAREGVDGDGNGPLPAERDPGARHEREELARVEELLRPLVAAIGTADVLRRVVVADAQPVTFRDVRRPFRPAA